MAKVLYSATMSLDGFIAGPGGDMSWLAEFLVEDPFIDDLVSRIKVILAGRRTFDGDDPNRGTDKEGAFQGAWQGPQVVLTHRPPATPVPGVTFVDDLGRAVAAAKEAAGDGYVNVLGADVARQCLEAGHVDEILVFVAPILLGDGTRLFAHPGGATVKLEPIQAASLPTASWLWLRVVG
ncbi:MULTISPECIES: dihydrofolate reductase family protein [Pseudofrankia]|uniref:dihydrofolate reductase family protein n=1 Tax=Pseudofrankia TaxID=2994363 RepID=UPI000234BCDB|nr:MULTISPECIES: dihydrofolate reductase family protein [Pseudofrankia]OHV41586.1 deaminase [Pseudofrankia sp. EUN1h]